MRNQAEPWNFAAIKTRIKSINRDSPNVLRCELRLTRLKGV
jgi:hypothetical protein